MKRSQLTEIVREVLEENEFDAALKQTFNQVAKEFEAQDAIDDEQGQEVKESALTIAGLVLSGPTIFKIIGKITKVASKFFGGKRATGDKIVAAADRAHHFLIGIIEKLILKVAPKVDKKIAHKISEGIFYLIIAGLLGAGGLAQAKYQAAGDLSGAAIKGAQNAVKTGEIVAYLRTFVKGAAGV